jgi:hypothetical protein
MRAVSAVEPQRTLFRWVLDTDLKGWIPRAVIDAALCGAQMDYMATLRKRASYLHQSGAVRAFLERQAGIAK